MGHLVADGGVELGRPGQELAGQIGLLRTQSRQFQ